MYKIEEDYILYEEKVLEKIQSMVKEKGAKYVSEIPGVDIIDKNLYKYIHMDLRMKPETLFRVGSALGVE